jgi:hypothetical protein
MVFQKGNQLGKLNVGRKVTKETRKKLSTLLTGKKRSLETRRKMSLSKIGDKHPLWRGNKVSKGQLHQWVKRHKQKKELCEECNLKPPTDLANISGKYKRDINDFKWLCEKCHLKEHKEQSRKNIKRAIKLNGYGNKHPRWKGGKPKCIECGKLTGGTYKSIRCRACYLKLKIRGKRGKYSHIL